MELLNNPVVFITSLFVIVICLCIAYTVHRVRKEKFEKRLANRYNNLMDTYESICKVENISLALKQETDWDKRRHQHNDICYENNLSEYVIHGNTFNTNRALDAILKAVSS